MNLFKKRITELRLSKKLSQEELGRQIGLSRGRISNYEAGTRVPDYETLNLFADYFNVSIDYLLGRTDDPLPKEKKDRSDDLEAAWPSTMSVLRRAGRPPTPEEEKRIARIIEAAIPDPDNEKFQPKKKR